MTPTLPSDPAATSLHRAGRLLVLAGAFLGWMFAGWEMSLLPLCARAATIGMLAEDPEHRDWVAVATTAKTLSAVEGASPESNRLEQAVAVWFARYIAAFLLGAAVGGWVFGWYGDHAGRVKAMSVSILWYAGFSGLSYFVATPLQMTAMRFVACMGIGGMWPAGVALVSEAWPEVSRPTLAGLIGTAANVGIAALGIVVSLIGKNVPGLELTPDSWRWMMLLGALPMVLGIFVLVAVPESPRWLAQRSMRSDQPWQAPLREIFRPPLLKYTLSGIALGTVPLLGAWGAQKWMIPWAGKVGAAIGNESLKADTQTIWALGAAIGSLCGGWLATLLGRRTTYFLVSLGSLALAGYIFRFTEPADDWNFLGPVFALGLVATVYFGWLPLYLPELFPTRVRATGSGVSFNSGRIISAVLVLATMGLAERFGGDYAEIGKTAAFVYLAGMVVILLVPRTTGSLTEDPQ